MDRGEHERWFAREVLPHEADVRALNITRQGLQTRFEVQRRGADTLSIRLNLPGTHNVLNALAAISVATELGVSDTAIQRALVNFQGIDL